MTAALEPTKRRLDVSAVTLIERMAMLAPYKPATPSIHDGIMFGADVAVSEWVKAHTPSMAGREFGSCVALGILRNDALVGGVVFNNHHRAAREIEASGAVAPGFRIALAGLRRILRYPFQQLGCVRVTLSTARNNKAARAFAERLGARFEGVKRQAFDGRQDQMIYGLLREDCRFLKLD